jgi:prepilin-type processing-associated H-X9-DG protein
MALPMIPQDDIPNKGNILFNYVRVTDYCPAAWNHVESFYAPMNQWVLPIHYSYGMNVEGVDSDQPLDLDIKLAPQADKALNSTTANPYGSFAGYRASQVKHAAEKIFMADALYIAINMRGVNNAPNGINNKESNYDITLEHTDVNTNGLNTARTTAWRHGSKKDFANVLFFDGHVDLTRKDVLYTGDSKAGTALGNPRVWKVLE